MMHAGAGHFIQPARQASAHRAASPGAGRRRAGAGRKQRETRSGAPGTVNVIFVSTGDGPTGIIPDHGHGGVTIRAETVMPPMSSREFTRQ